MDEVNLDEVLRRSAGIAKHTKAHPERWLKEPIGALSFPLHDQSDPMLEGEMRVVIENPVPGKRRVVFEAWVPVYYEVIDLDEPTNG